jgi:hypothetical protein
MQNENQKCAYIRPLRNKEYRIFELLAEIKKNKISLDGIDIVSDPDQIILYQFAEELYRGVRIGAGLWELYQKIKGLYESKI